jgi:hypothetical protein
VSLPPTTVIHLFYIHVFLVDGTLSALIGTPDDVGPSVEPGGYDVGLSSALRLAYIKQMMPSASEELRRCIELRD